MNSLAGHTQQPKKVAEAFLDALGDIVRQSLEQGHEIVLPGMGRFAVKELRARAGRNPRTSAAIQIGVRKAPALTAANVLKTAVSSH